METTSVQHTTPISTSFDNAEQSPSDEQPRVQPQRTPSVALIDFDGNTKIVRANSVRRVCATRQCLNFCIHCVVLFIVMMLGLTMMIARGMSSPDFPVWSSIFTLGVGAFLPEPKISKDDDAKTTLRKLRQVVVQ
jgi:hypothetical protein